MLGPAGSVAAVVDALTDRLPGVLAGMRTRMNDASIPSVNQVLGHEPDQVGLEWWPIVVVTAVGDRDWLPMEPEPGDLSRGWRVNYQVRCTTWVRGDDYASTTRFQHLLHTAVVEALLSDLDVAAGVRVDDRSLAASMSEIAATEAGRTFAGSRLDLVVVVEERLPVGVPAEVVVESPDITLLPR